MSYLSIIYSTLKIVHFYPNQKFNIFFYLYTILIIISSIFVTIIFILNFMNPDISAEDLKQNVNVAGALLQFYPKLYVYVMYKNEMQENNKESTLFWDVDESDLEKELKDEIKKLIKRGIIYTSIFLFFAFFTVPVYFSTVLKYFHTDLPSFVPHQINSKFLSIFLRVCVTFFTLNVLVIVTVFDTLTLCTCTSLDGQFLFLAHQMKYIINNNRHAGSDKRKELIVCVEYHIFLLRFAERMKKMLAPYFLAIYCQIILIAGSQMFIIAFSSDFLDIAPAVLFIFVSYYIYGIYCFPMSNVSDKSVLISDIIYDSNWYDESKEIKDYLRLTMLRSQVQFNFTIGGMKDVSRENFTEVFNICMSVYAIAKAVRDIIEEE